MSARFCLRLALNNLTKNKRLYAPYMITSVGMIAMFYIVQFLYVNKGLEGSGSIGVLREMMGLGGIVTAIFVAIFLFYTNSFLIRQRGREFGLYGILGLEKKHIGKIMLMETAALFALCLIVGLAAGILFSKAMFLLLLKFLKVEVAFGFEIPAYAVAVTAALFAGVFALTLIWNLFQVHLSQPVELLRAGKVGEREPRVKWLFAVLGALCLGGGYALAQMDVSPVAVISTFFVAIILVIAGTYQLFTAGSIAVLKMMRRNKNYYYQTRHFISVSGMIYRMKRNAAGLASICILSTAVLVMLSTTISMYAGMEDVLRTRFPYNVFAQARNVSAADARALDALIEGEIESAGVPVENISRRLYRFFLVTRGEDGAFHGSGERYDQDRNVVWVDYASLVCVPLSEYNRERDTPAALGQGEVLIHSTGRPYEGETIAIGDLAYAIKGIASMDMGEDAMSRSMENHYLVVPDDAIGRIAAALGEEEVSSDALTYSYGFDVDASPARQIELANALRAELKQAVPGAYVECAEASRQDMLATYGGLLFLGLFLGSLFIIATVMIIYYKQVSEGYDDRDRFSIMQKVGLTKAEVRSAIRSQVLTVFYLPLLMSVIHIAAAHKVMVKLLAILNLTNTGLFALCTLVMILLFACFYTAIYGATARTYYRIVGE